MQLQKEYYNLLIKKNLSDLEKELEQKSTKKIIIDDKKEKKNKSKMNKN